MSKVSRSLSEFSPRRAAAATRRTKASAMLHLFACLLLGCAALSLAGGAPAEAGQDRVSPQASTSGDGVLKKAKFLADTGPLNNSSNTIWINAFDTTVTLTGGAPQCVELRYSGEFFVASSSPFHPLMMFRALIDGVPAQGSDSGGSVYVNAPEYDLPTTTAFNWWQCDLASGGTSHTVQVQFKPYYGAHTASVKARSLIIEFKAGN